ncbi:alpha/beta fold hydrolase [Nocardioides sp. Kera G14]|uniref:alpha/beta fold hydrolase n=1 Tax=Nocardioides sp. Kera G14 TaxID=2884264 RepID=UPI001D1183D6|nr:alpha/beta fold hydrolase [Nocardioides sp. Kera G14]UDY24201.1 alpha/beta hydrolase [Nocardioides sp. Kera G14]
MSLLPRVPSRSTLTSAAGNVAHKVMYGGIADLRPMPKALIDEGWLREVYRYRPVAGVTQVGDPVLLVPPLAAPALCYDLRRGCSLVEHLVSTGRPTYLVDYGQISFRDRSMGIEHWVDELLPEAIRAVSRDAGGRPVHVAGWSLGGIFATLAVADAPDLPVASLTIFGSPFDVTRVPLVAPFRPLVDFTNGRIITTGYQLIGSAPKPIVKWVFQLSSVDKVLTKPWAIATHLGDTDFLAQIEAVDHFTANMTAYPGRSFGQLYHRFFRSNVMMDGRVEVGDRFIELDRLTVPTRIFAGATDAIAPVKSVEAIVPLLSSAEEVRFDIVPGGHLGMLTGRAARRTTWPMFDEWMRDHDGRVSGVTSR